MIAHFLDCQVIVEAGEMVRILGLIAGFVACVVKFVVGTRAAKVRASQ